MKKSGRLVSSGFVALRLFFINLTEYLKSKFQNLKSKIYSEILPHMSKKLIALNEDLLMCVPINLSLTPPTQTPAKRYQGQGGDAGRNQTCGDHTPSQPDRSAD